MKTPAARAFTLLELLVVMGLIGALSFFLVGGLAGSSKGTSLQSAQAILASMVTVARTQAAASGAQTRIMIHIDANSPEAPNRYLRYVVVLAADDTILADAYLPAGVYVVPGNFSAMPEGVFPAAEQTQWRRPSDGANLRSTALRSNRTSAHTINGVASEQWVRISIARNGNTAESGDLIVAIGRARAPGSYTSGASPVELTNPATVRGLTLSSYGLARLVNSLASF